MGAPGHDHLCMCIVDMVDMVPRGLVLSCLHVRFLHVLLILYKIIITSMGGLSGGHASVHVWSSSQRVKTYASHVSHRIVNMLSMLEEAWRCHDIYTML